jgi:peptide/nickel transport system ATP-binding protein
LLEQIRRDRKLTFLMVSHDLAVITHMCDRLMVMQNGAEVERLTAAELTKRKVSQDYTRNLLIASQGFVRPEVPAGG